MTASTKHPAVTAALFIVLSVPSGAAPTANLDAYEMEEDSTLVASAGIGVLQNDDRDVDTVLSAILQTDPANGRLDFQSDGGFTYTPDPDFNGSDSFTYSAEQLPEVLTFNVDQSQSNVDFGATVTASGITRSDSDNSSITGTLQLFLSPGSEPFDRVQIRDIDLVLADAVELEFNFVTVPIIGTVLVGVSVNAAGGALSMQMVQPGAETTADGAGTFTQPGNTLRITGVASVVSVGVPGLESGDQNLDIEVPDVELGGTLTQSGSIITLTAPVTFTGEFDLGGNPISVEIDGTVVATAAVPTPQATAAQTVVIDVDPVNDAPSLKPDAYTANDGATGPVSAAAGVVANDEDIENDPILAAIASGPDNGEVNLNPDGSFDYLGNPGFVGSDSFIYSVINGGGTSRVEFISAGSAWRFLDDGSDQGTAWREPGFNDAGWDGGSGQLGYGEGDEATVVSFGADPNSKHVTTYFRREFHVGDPTVVSSLLLRLLRDDAAVVYLNGTEVFRDLTLPQDPSPVLFNSLAGAAVDEADATVNVAIPTAHLVVGANVLAVEVHQSSLSSSDLSFDASFEGQAPPPSAVVRFDDEWSYLDDGSDQGSAWRNVGFDDGAWSNGPAPLGYGEPAPATAVGFGPDSGNKHVTTYFRTEFELIDAELAIAGQLRLRRDDGLAIYLNGVEIARDNLADGAGHLTFADGAIGGEDEEDVLVYSFDPGLLQEGINVLAAEVHQATAGSSDLFFEAELGVSMAVIKQRATVEVLTPNPNDPDSDNDGMLDSWEEANGLIVGIDDSLGDSDGDGSKNIFEFLADTDPQDPASYLRVLAVQEAGGGQLTITVATEPGVSYRLQVSPDGSNWQDVAGSDWTADGDTYQIDVAQGEAPRFWRAIVVTEP